MCTGDFYVVGFSENGGYNCVLLDREYKLLTELYYCDGNIDLFDEPEMGSKVGRAFIRNVGLAYYNTDGDIIWITYCRQQK